MESAQNGTQVLGMKMIERDDVNIGRVEPERAQLALDGFGRSREHRTREITVFLFKLPKKRRRARGAAIGRIEKDIFQLAFYSYLDEERTMTQQDVRDGKWYRAIESILRWVDQRGQRKCSNRYNGGLRSKFIAKSLGRSADRAKPWTM